MIEVWGLNNEGCYANVEKLKGTEIREAEQMRQTDRGIFKERNDANSIKSIFYLNSLFI